MKQLGLMIDMDRCIGCKTCVVACRNSHNIVDHENCMPGEIPYYIRIESESQGTYPMVTEHCWVVPCQHCNDPACSVSCPRGAITKNPETGIVRIDKEVCDGCNAVQGSITRSKQLISPCKANCPAHMNVQGYVRLVAEGKFHEALKLMKEENPFPAVCGRVCDHPCESYCNRGEIDEPVAINMIKRFVADLDLKAETRFVPPIEKKRKERVGVIGSGPAGLTCAFYLAKQGYRVTVFEKDSRLGGMLTSGIPYYRLPHDLVEAEINVIRDMGVEMKTNVELGKDTTVERLRQDGYKAFFLGIGAQECKDLQVEGEGLEGVHPGLDLLCRINHGETMAFGKRVAVIGGGNVAFDAVRTARRLGGEGAFIIYRRTEEEMLANKDEISEAKAEGIVIQTLTQPIRFIGQNGRVAKIRCVKMKLGQADESGRRAPEPILGSEFEIDVDAVITALGQETDWACLTAECACQLTDWGTMKVDPLTLQSDDPDIFAGGDAVSGPRTVIEAIAAGKEAAISIDRFLRGVDLRAGRGKKMEVATEFQKQKYHPAKRAHMPVLQAAERVKNFDEVQLGLNQDTVVEEAKRCLGCGCSCIQACPYDVIQFDLQTGVSHKCDLCHDRVVFGLLPVCAETCMTDAIGFGEVEELRARALEKGREIDQKMSPMSVVYLKPTLKNTLATG